MTTIHWRSLTLTVEPAAISDIRHVCNDMVNLARVLGCEIQFEFNETRLEAKPDTDPVDLLRAYAAKRF